MSPYDRPPTVAVFNSSEDTTAMLRACLQERGFSSVVTGHVPGVNRRLEEFVEFLRVHDPRVIVWDVGIPYEENWRFLQSVLTTDVMSGRALVLTTTNKAALESFVGPTETIEIFGKPYDLERFVEAVARAARVAPRPQPE